MQPTIPTNWPFKTYNGVLVPAVDQKQIPQFQPEYEPDPDIALF